MRSPVEGVLRLSSGGQLAHIDIEYVHMASAARGCKYRNYLVLDPELSEASLSILGGVFRVNVLVGVVKALQL